MSDPILSVRNLTVTFTSEAGTNTAVRDLSLDLERGRTTAIVGESGSGKSVTALASMRLIQRPGQITGGSIHLYPDGQDAFDVTALSDNDDLLYELRGGLTAMIFQEPMTALSPVHTIGNQVMEAITTHRDVTEEEAFERAVDMLTRVGIPDARARMHAYPFEFSGGMRQRVVIAMALVCEPQLLICDEPTTALDVTVQAEVLALIRSLRDELGVSVLFITHDLGVVAQIADDVIVMHRGRVLETGPVRDILRDPLHPYTRALLAAIPGRDSGERLLTVDDTLTEGDLDDWPLLPVGENRQVALPNSRLPGNDDD